MTINVDRLRELCAKGLNPIQMAERLGATPNAIYKACERHNLSAAVVKGYESRAASFARRAFPRTESYGSGSHEVP
jgi:hypothetical protein